MKNDLFNFENEEGFSYVELLVVILIIGIISTIAIMNISSAKVKFKSQTVAQELKVAFERARFDSVKRRTQSGSESYVTVDSTSFVLNSDVNQNGVVESSEARVNSSWDTAITIVEANGTPLSSAKTVAFNRRGELTTLSSASFLVCEGNCSTPSKTNSNLVVITPTGTVNILPGGSTQTTFSPPSITNSNTNTDIRSVVRTQ